MRRVQDPSNVRLACVSVEFGMQVMALFLAGFVHLNGNSMGVRPRILPNAGNLLGDFHSAMIGTDDELVCRHFRADPRLCRLSDGCELVAEVAIERLEPVREQYCC